jgi:lysine 6-dehydrogenase
VKVLVLGGCGIQGKAAVYDCAKNTNVDEVICADADLHGIVDLSTFTNMAKVTPVTVDANDQESLVRLLEKVDVAIDLLPRQFLENVCRAAIDAGVSVVNSNYATPISHLNDEARQAGVSIMPECGLDPGIDLILYGEARRRFDELTTINSYCGGIPERSACDNPLNYKVSWVFEGVLASTKRRGRVIRDGEVIHIPSDRQHHPDYVQEIGFPGLGTLEAIPNGDAVFFTDALGVTETIRETGRYSLRWPGWSAFWFPLKRLGFLGENPVAGLPCEVSPYQMVDKLLESQLQYQRNEKDLVAMFNVFEGRRNGALVRWTSRLLIERNLKTGLMAMAQGVAYPAAIVAQMIADGEIKEKGLLSPMEHIPYPAFIDALRKRKIVVEEEEIIL